MKNVVSEPMSSFSYVKANFLYCLGNVDLTNNIKIIDFTPLSPVSFTVICLFSEYQQQLWSLPQSLAQILHPRTLFLISKWCVCAL